MSRKKPIPLAGSSPCSATTLGEVVLDRGVQPAALIARLEREAVNLLEGAFDLGGAAWMARGLIRAIEIIQSEFTTNERDAAGDEQLQATDEAPADGRDANGGMA